MRTFTFSICSPRNINFNYTETITLEDLCLDEEDWQEMSEAEQEQALDDYAQQLIYNKYISYAIEED